MRKIHHILGFIAFILLSFQLADLSSGCDSRVFVRAYQKSYWIESYSVDVDVTSEGHADVVESITFAFHGGVFSKGFREIPLKGLSGIANIGVSWRLGILPFTIEEGSFQRLKPL